MNVGRTLVVTIGLAVAAVHCSDDMSAMTRAKTAAEPTTPLPAATVSTRASKGLRVIDAANVA